MLVVRKVRKGGWKNIRKLFFEKQIRQSILLILFEFLGARCFGNIFFPVIP